MKFNYSKSFNFSEEKTQYLELIKYQIFEYKINLILKLRWIEEYIGDY